MTKPRALKILEGNPGHQALRPEPEPTKGIPQPPAHLSDKERLVWDKIARELDAFGMAYHLDGYMLEGFVVNYCRAVECDLFLRREGRTYTIMTKQGNEMPVPRPEVAISASSWKAAKTFGSEFGLSMASRGKLALGKVKQIDDLETLLSSDTAEISAGQIQ